MSGGAVELNLAGIKVPVVRHVRRRGLAPSLKGIETDDHVEDCIWLEDLLSDTLWHFRRYICFALLEIPLVLATWLNRATRYVSLVGNDRFGSALQGSRLMATICRWTHHYPSIVRFLKAGLLFLPIRKE